MKNFVMYCINSSLLIKGLLIMSVNKKTEPKIVSCIFW